MINNVITLLLKKLSVVKNNEWIYYSLGLVEEAKKTASVLGYNYPKSKWYKYSYNILEDESSKKSKKSNLFKKILNKISSNNEK